MIGHDAIDSKIAKKATIEVKLAGRVFLFDLCHRTLQFGDAGNIQYYWMDSSLLRQGSKASNDDARNLRNCIGIWWRAAKLAGANREASQIRHLLLASCYGLFGNDKGPQDVYHDAHLGQKIPRYGVKDECVVELEPEYTQRDVAASLSGMLTDSSLSGGEITIIGASLEGILADGVRRFQDDAQQGTLHFVSKIDSWSANVRKRGGRPWRRQCLNQFEYSSKISFYRCYANAWIHIIAALEQAGLDELSSRFLRFWHWQNQPSLRPDGSLEPDVFGGQILALHPLSAFVMQDPTLLSIVGRFLNSITSQDIDAQNYAMRDEYRAFTGAVLLAAQRYANARQEQSARRSQPKGKPRESSEVIEENTISDSMRLTDFLAASKIHCSVCHGPLECREIPSADQGIDRTNLRTQCLNCHQEQSIEITCDQFRRFLFDLHD